MIIIKIKFIKIVVVIVSVVIEGVGEKVYGFVGSLVRGGWVVKVYLKV